MSEPSLEKIADMVRAYMKRHEIRPEFVPGTTRIPLSVPSYGGDEVVEAMDSLLSTWVTMGRKVKEFESLFADYLGAANAIMVNSGSSANLLALSALTNPTLNDPLKVGDEIITPAVTWATTVYPIINVGAVPVLTDVDLHSFNLDPNAVEQAITAKTKAILLVHLLGRPCDMDAFKDIARRHNLYLIEDSCEAHGAEYKGQRVGTFGDMSTFSFFFSHHISTIEGGMVVTNNEELSELCRALRVFGWARDLKNRDTHEKENPEIDPRFLFVNSGYNLRPTEIQGAFGIHQMPRLDNFIEGRRSNAAFWSKNLAEYEKYLILPEEPDGTRVVWFGYPVTVRPNAPFTRRDLVAFLESKGLETRPIMTGNIVEQPGLQMFNYRVNGLLENAQTINQQSFFFGNHQNIGDQERESILDYFKDFFSEVGS